MAKRKQLYNAVAAIESIHLYPCLKVEGHGKYTYIWIGNRSSEKEPWICYAILRGKEKLQKLAEDILKRLGENPHNSPVE